MKYQRIWIGHWLGAVALLHTVVGLVMGAPVLAQMLREGLFNTANRSNLSSLASWFLLFGALLALLGMAVSALERAAQPASIGRLGVGALLLALVGIFLMPLSGFWLLLPAAVAMLRTGAHARLARA